MPMINYHHNMNVETYTPAAGETINQTAAAMVAQAVAHNCEVNAEFDDEPLSAAPTTSPDYIRGFYWGRRTQRHRLAGPRCA
jgi:hypothetical protein